MDSKSGEEPTRQRARRAINAARNGWLPNLQTDSLSTNPFGSAKENAIESSSNDNKFSRNIVLTRSARMRKFKFYQFQPSLNTKETKTSPGYSSNDSISKSSVSVDSPLPSKSKGVDSASPVHAKQLSYLDREIEELDKYIEDSRKSDDLVLVFELVNKKNDLLRRQMQLNILEQEKALELESEKLNKELRSLLSKTDEKKTQDELDRQRYLNDRLVHLVNKRDELVHHLDLQERGVEDDNALKKSIQDTDRNSLLKKNRNSHDQNCSIQ